VGGFVVDAVTCPKEVFIEYAIKGSAYFSRLETLSLPRFAEIAAFDRVLRLSQAPTQHHDGKLWAFCSVSAGATFQLTLPAYREKG
jgi:hypothetical protein